MKEKDSTAAVVEAVELVGNRRGYGAVGYLWVRCGQLAVHSLSTGCP